MERSKPAPTFDETSEAVVPWDSLTVSSLKKGLYTAEFVADEAWSDLQREFGGRALDLLMNHTFIILKPETMARRCVSAVLEYLATHKFTPVAHRIVKISRSIGHQVWRYQWNAASVDRVCLTTFAHELTPSLFIVLRNDTSSAIPATVRLRQLKGSAFANKRTPNHLRSVVGMTNRMLGFVHCPDEPADALRELGILFFDRERELLFCELNGRSNSDHLIRAQRFEATCAPHVADAAPLIDRLISLGGGTGLHRLAIDARLKRCWPLRAVRQVFEDEHTGPLSWDYVMLAAELIRHDRPNVGPLIVTAPAEEIAALWLERSDAVC